MKFWLPGPFGNLLLSAAAMWVSPCAGKVVPNCPRLSLFGQLGPSVPSCGIDGRTEKRVRMASPGFTVYLYLPRKAGQPPMTHMEGGKVPGPSEQHGGKIQISLHAGANFCQCKVRGRRCTKCNLLLYHWKACTLIIEICIVFAINISSRRFAS